MSVVVAQALVAAFGDITRFASADKAASYLGLVPSTKQSAKTCHHGPITKHGNSNARWLLVQAAQPLLAIETLRSHVVAVEIRRFLRVE